MEFALRVDYLRNVRPVLGVGMLGVFIVTGIIIGVVTLLNRWVKA